MDVVESAFPARDDYLPGILPERVEASYDDYPIWREINAQFPNEFRVPGDDLPDEFSFEWSGCTVHVDRYVHDRSPVRIILHHGLGTNARLMTMILGYALHRIGYDVAALDMPYVGATRTPDLRFTYADWVRLSTDYINYGSGADDRPVVLFGFSVGGMLSYDVSCINHRVVGVCGTCFIDLREHRVRREIAKSPTWNAVMEKAADVVLGLGVRPSIPLTTFADKRTISNSPELNDILARDTTSLGGRFPLDFLSSLRTHRMIIAPEEFDRCPVALLQCEYDRNIPHQTNKRFFDRIAAPKEFALIEGAGHIPLCPYALKRLTSYVWQFVEAVR